MSANATVTAGRRFNVHRELRLRSPWIHQSDVEVRAYVQEPHGGTPEEVLGRAVLTLYCGAFSLSLRPTSADLRALAALLLATADDNDGTEAA